MTESMRNVIEELKRKLKMEENDFEWHIKKMKEHEKNVLDLKETINQLETGNIIPLIQELKPQAIRKKWYQRLLGL